MTVPVGKLRLRVGAVPIALAAAAFTVGAAGFVATFKMPDYSRPAARLAEVVWPEAWPQSGAPLPPAVVVAVPEASETPAEAATASAASSEAIVAARPPALRPVNSSVAESPAVRPAPVPAAEPAPAQPEPTPTAGPSPAPAATQFPDPGEVGAAGSSATPVPATPSPTTPPATPTPTTPPPSSTPAPSPAGTAEPSSGPGKRLGVSADNPGNGPKNDKNESKSATNAVTVPVQDKKK